MPVENTWLVQNRVLLTRLYGDLTVEDLIESAQVGTQMIENGITPLFSIVEMSGIQQVPMNLSDLNRIVKNTITSDKLSWILIVGIPNRFISFMATIFTQLIKTNYVTLENLDKAKDFIGKRDVQISEALQDPVALTQ